MCDRKICSFTTSNKTSALHFVTSPATQYSTSWCILCDFMTLFIVLHFSEKYILSSLSSI